MELHLGRLIAGSDGHGLARLDDVLSGHIVLHLGDGVFAGYKILHINLALLISDKGFLIAISGHDKGDTLHKIVLRGLANEQPAFVTDGDSLVLVLQIGVNGNLLALMVHALEHNDGLASQSAGRECKGHFYGAGGLFGDEDILSGDFLAIHQQFLTSALVHKHALDLIGLSGDQVPVGNGVGQSDGFQRIDLFFTVHGGIGLDFRTVKLHGLALVGDVRMSGNLFALVIKGFKDYHGLASQRGGVKGERHLNTTDCTLRGKLFLSSDLLPVHQEGRTAGFVHENAGQLVGFARGQAGVGNGVGDGDLTLRLGFLLTVHSGSCLDFRFLAEGHSLVLILNISMGADLQLVPIERFKSHNRLSRQSGGVKGKGDVDSALGVAGPEGSLSSDFLVIHHQRFAGSLVHKHTLHGVFFARNQARVFHRVDNGNLANRLCAMLPIGGSSGAYLRLGKLYGLALVLYVRMAGYLVVTFIQVLEHHQRLASQGRGVKGIAQFLGAVFSLGGELLLRCNLLTVHSQRVAGGLVHENTRQLIGLAQGQAGVTHGVYNGDFGQRLTVLLAINRGSGPDFRGSLMSSMVPSSITVLSRLMKMLGTVTSA